MKIYLVGGAVRDKLLNLPQHDRDWVVVGASVEDMLQNNFLQVGKGFPVFLHPQSKEEYALARTEKKTAPGYTGFEFNTSKEVTLEEDLQRRDLTINAIAEDSKGLLIDPYNGRKDITDRVLRHVSASFSEDPLRVLRVARFASRYAHLGFRVASETKSLMKEMVKSQELDHLVPERVWQEIERSLGEKSPGVFFNILFDCGALRVILPEFHKLFNSPHDHSGPEAGTPNSPSVITSLEGVALTSDDPVVRFATMAYFLEGKGLEGKGLEGKRFEETELTKSVIHRDERDQHSETSTKLTKNSLQQLADRLKIPKEFYQLACLVCSHQNEYRDLMDADAAAILGLLDSLDAFRRPTRLEKFLPACQSNMNYGDEHRARDFPQSERLREAYLAAKNIDTSDLKAFSNAKSGNRSGDHIKEWIREKRIAAIDHSLKINSAN